MNEKDSIQALERQARNTNRLMDNLCLAWKGRTWEEAHMDYTFEDYRKALEGAGPKLKELILDRCSPGTLCRSSLQWQVSTVRRDICHANCGRRVHRQISLHCLIAAAWMNIGSHQRPVCSLMPSTRETIGHGTRCSILHSIRAST